LFSLFFYWLLFFLHLLLKFFCWLLILSFLLGLLFLVFFVQWLLVLLSVFTLLTLPLLLFLLVQLLFLILFFLLKLFLNLLRILRLILLFLSICEFLELGDEEAVHVVDVGVDSLSQVQRWVEPLVLVFCHAWFSNLNTCFYQLHIPCLKGIVNHPFVFFH
jgi:hypothetical protein